MTIEEIWTSNQPMGIRCSTIEQARALTIVLHFKGYKWCSGRSYDDSHYMWESYKEKTCYLNDGTYCIMDYAQEHNIKIIEFLDVEDLKRYTSLEKVVLPELTKEFEI